jgi:hypothetical protein
MSKAGTFGSISCSARRIAAYICRGSTPVFTYKRHLLKIVVLIEIQERLRTNRGAHRRVLGVPDEADDLDVGPRARIVPHPEEAADRVLPWKEPARERLVDDRHFRCAPGLRRGKRLSGDERCAQRSKITG